MKVPNRHRSHQLEAESIREFQTYIPSTWVFRSTTDDYGIDGEVEIFDKKGAATGKKFLIQFKATDEENTNKALKLRLRVETANYFDKLSSPVLIIRYLASNRNMYCRWFHSFDPHWESFTKKSLAFNFKGSNIWNENQVKILERELDEYIMLRGNRYPFPISMPLYFTPDFPLASNAARFAASVISKANKYSDIIRLKLSPVTDQKPPSYIVFDQEKLHVVLANRTASCLHFKDGLGQEVKDRIISNLFVAIGLGLSFWGYGVEVGRLLFDNILSSTLKYDIKAITLVISGLLQAQQQEKVLFIAENLFKEEKGINAAQAALISVIRSSNKSESSEIGLLSESLKKISISLLNQDIIEVAGVIEYNHANLLRSASNLKEAINLYNLAAKHDKQYKERSYWYSEVAGCLFLLRRYRFSSWFYKSSLDLEYNLQVLSLYADSLMFAGYFEKSLNEFQKYFDEVPENKLVPEWQLKALCLHAIVNTLKVNEQPPFHGSYDFQELIDSDEDSFIKHLKENDVWCGEIWFHLGVSVTKEDRYDDATVCFLMAAFCEYQELDSWGNAIKCSFKEELSPLSIAILQCAYEKFGQEFILNFSEIDSIDEEKNEVEAQTRIVELLQLLNERNNSGSDYTVRMHGPDGSFDIYQPIENYEA